MLDRYQRKIEYARISLTDKCNLRCKYCMPETGVNKLRHEDILNFSEIMRVVNALARLGIKKMRLTGGEPLVRRGILDLIREIKNTAGITEVALTTNAVLLPKMLPDLEQAKLDALNISLDTLDNKTFQSITRRDLFNEVMAGITAVKNSTIKNIKLNCVPIYDVNEDDICRLAELTRDNSFKVRFIELMPIGCAYEVGYRGVPMNVVQEKLIKHFGTLLELPPAGGLSGPARYYKINGFKGEIGFIDAIEHKFCASCNRVRLTAEGFLKLCLNANAGLDLRALIRGGINDEDLTERIKQAIYKKPAEHLFFSRGEETRDRRAMYQVGG